MGIAGNTTTGSEEVNLGMLPIKHVVEAYLNSTPNVTRVTKDNISAFFSDNFRAVTDPFADTDAYALITGRKGLWAVQEGDETCFVMWHCNRNEPIVGANQQLLILPGIHSSPNFIARTASLIPVNSQYIDIIRVDEDIANQYLETGFFDKKKEKTLDWVLPCQILDTSRVIECRGGDFEKLRQATGKFSSKQDIEFYPITDSNRDSFPDMLDFWLKQKGNKDVAPVMQSYFLECVRLSRQPNGKAPPLEGRTVMFSEGDDTQKKVGHIFFHQNLGTGEATFHGFVHNGEKFGLKHLPEFTLYKFCRYLYDRGIKKLHIGGTETNSLYQFYKKFGPIREYRVQTLGIKPEAMPL